MSKIKTQFKDFGFNRNHLALLFFVFVTVGLLSYSREPLMLQNLLGLKDSKAEQQPSIDEIIDAKVAAYTAELRQEVSGQDDDSFNSKKESLSLLDPNFSEGSVLGVSTEAEKSLAEVMSDENLSQIEIKISANTDRSFNEYLQSQELLEDRYGYLLVMSALATRDASSSSKAMELLKPLIAESKNIAVPEAFARFHRLKLMQYAAMYKMAEAATQEDNQEDAASSGLLFFEITNQLESVKVELINQNQ